MKPSIAASLFGGLILSGCLHAANTPQPARMSSVDAGQMEKLIAGLAGAVGRTNIELGAGDPLGEGTVVVLPPLPTSLETHSLAMPVTFNLELRGDTCVAVRQDTGEAFELPGVDCTPKG